MFHREWGDDIHISIRDEDYLALLIDDKDNIQAAIFNQSIESLTIIKCSNNWGEAVEDVLYQIDKLRTQK